MRDWYRNGITLEVITSIQANTIQVDPTIIQAIIIQADQIIIQATLTLEVQILIQVKTEK